MKKVRNLQKLIPLLPLLLLAILFIFLPIISMVQKSFLSPETGAFTFNNYKTIFTDSVYQVATSNSLYLSFASTIIGLILSFFIAWAVNELGKNGQSRMLSMLNMVSNFAGLPLYFSFVVILGNTGIFVLALRAIGIQLSTVFRLYSIQGLLLMFIYFQLPLGSLMLVPAFQAVDYSWKEAAEILEASPFQFWTRIGIPVMLPSLLDTFALLFANAITAYASSSSGNHQYSSSSGKNHNHVYRRNDTAERNGICSGDLDDHHHAGRYLYLQSSEKADV